MLTNLTSDQLAELVSNLSGALDTLMALPGWGKVAFDLSDLVVSAEAELMARGELVLDFADHERPIELPGSEMLQ